MLTKPLRSSTSSASFAICNLWCQLKKVKDKNIYCVKKKKTHILLRILAVICRYGPHLMIVMMIFVTQNNLKTVQELPTVSLDFTNNN